VTAPAASLCLHGGRGAGGGSCRPRRAPVGARFACRVRRWAPPEQLRARTPNGLGLVFPTPGGVVWRKDNFIQAYLGHTSINVTLNTYGHLFPNAFADVDTRSTVSSARVNSRHPRQTPLPALEERGPIPAASGRSLPARSRATPASFHGKASDPRQRSLWNRARSLLMTTRVLIDPHRAYGAALRTGSVSPPR
jgi:hypothetical protein